ncbi:hypothetical protein H6F75_04055 [Nodosilinea sp. FACHB-131]|uniref:hypothetical protein n=1 Tax=Cyanophyceae TaxID=3028117 RepID=UPI0016847BE2|nr:hypothetical protein [Nodosilinea sp. FACHB-131]MBD1872645.1 hypothetical protein [Nodosilinea sp. FACHB-131]
MQTPLSTNLSRYAPAVDHLLFYKIVPDADGIRLRIWESATDLDQSPSPYLYILNLRVESMAEAKKRLKAHLALNGGTLSVGQELPQKGKVKLLPYPTWDGTEGMEDSY